MPYAVGLVGIAIAWGLRHLLDPLLEARYAFVLFLAPAFVVSRLGGWRAGSAILALGFLLAEFSFVEPRGKSSLRSATEFIGLISYAVVGLVGIVQSDWMRRRGLELALANVRLQEEAVARQRAETTLRRLAAVVGSFRDAIIAVDLDCIITDWNAGAERMYGYTATEAIGQPVSLIWPGDRAGEPGRMLERFRRGETVDPVESVRRRKDGSLVEVFLTVCATENQEGQLLGAASVSQDITRRKEIERALQESEGRFRQIADNITEVFLLMATNAGQILYVNPGYEKIWGRDPQHLYDNPLSLLETVHPEDQERVAAALRTMPWQEDMEYRVLRPDGSVRWVSFRTSPVRDDKGQVYRVVGLVQDITQRKQSEQRVELLLDSTEQGVYGIDYLGRCTFINRAAAEMLGYTAEEVIGRDLHALVHHHRADGSPYPEEECPVHRALLELRTIQADNELLWRKDGSPLPVEYSGYPMWDVSGIQGAIGAFTDITQKRQLEAQFRQAQKLESIGQLAAGIAHEINTPIQAVGDNTAFLQGAFDDLRGALEAYAELYEAARSGTPSPDLLDRVAGAVEKADLDYLNEEVPGALTQSLEGIERVAKIVRAMKEFSHPGSEEKVAVDINHAIETTLAVARNEWKYVAEVVTDLDPALPPVPSLAGELNQVLLNLLINAAHAIKEKMRDEKGRQGRIAISTRCLRGQVEIRVSDSGCGIPEAIRERIFDPFFTTKPLGQGTGQGLAITHAVIVKKHQGAITFESEVGKGTTFIISLPLAPKGPERTAGALVASS